MSKSPGRLSPAERRLRASIAGLTGWSRTPDRAARARHAQQGIYEKFVREVDPDCVLDEQTRHANAQSAYKAHYQRIALASAKARRKRKEAEQAAAAELKAARANKSRGLGVVT